VVNRKDILKTFLQEQISEHKSPVRDDLWSMIERNLPEKKRHPVLKKMVLALAVAAAILITVLLTLPIFDSNFQKLNLHKLPAITKSHHIYIPKYVPEVNDIPQKKQQPSLTKENNINKVPESVQPELVITDSIQNVEETDQHAKLVAEEKDAVADKDEKTKPVRSLTDNNPKMEIVKKKDPQKISLSLIATNTITEKSSSNYLTHIGSGDPSENPELKNNHFLEYDFPVNIGFMVRKNLTNKFAIESGLSYTYLSTKETISPLNKPETVNKIKLHYLGIPVKVVYNLYDSDRLSVYSSLGIMLEKSISGKQESIIQNNSVNEDLDIPELQWSFSGSIGLNYKLIPQWGLFIEPGAAYFINDHSGIPTIRKNKPFNFNIQGGIRFSY